MLERMRDILERIDELNTSFRGMAHRHHRPQNQAFNDLLTKAQQAPVAPTSAMAPAMAPAMASARAPAGLTPVGIPSPATRPPAQFSDLIKKYADLHGLNPQLVRKVIQTESNFDPQTTSKRGAQGLMQLMPDTARELGVADPFDPEQNIAGGSKYLAMMLDRFGGDVRKALAAYNAGPTAVQNHGGVPPFPETRRFVSKVLAKSTDKYQVRK